MPAYYRKNDLVLLCGQEKAGATSGWNTASNLDTHTIATVPASQTNSTLVIGVTGLNVGDKIDAFYLVGQIESAGGTVTLDCSLRKQTMAAAEPTDASVAAMTQISVTADTAISATNSRKVEVGATVIAGEVYYFLLTATTGSSTDIRLHGVVVETRAQLHN